MYTRCILKEISSLKGYVVNNNKKLRAVYIGGGTPTTLSVKQLDMIISKVNKLRESSCELTVEAGRADTLSEDILRMFKSNDVNRISINAQTMNDATLELVNRRHSTQDVLKWIDKSSLMGFIINSDIIMGLPGETFEDMILTLKAVEKLNIDNLTVHTLAVKRASKMKMEKESMEYEGVGELEDIVDLSRDTARKMGLRPYYMYKQKYMSSNLENVGYAKKNKECIYNIDIMEESHSIIAIGAGAVSKRMFYDINHHKRFANPKSVEHYINNIDLIITKKEDFFKLVKISCK